MNKNTLTVTDNRTGVTYEIPISTRTINAFDLRQVNVDPYDVSGEGPVPRAAVRLDLVWRIAHIPNACEWPATRKGDLQ